MKVNSCRTQSGQLNLIGMLVAISVLIIIAAWYMTKIAAVSSPPGAPLTPTERAYGAGCSEYTSQMNQAVTMYKMDHDDHPPTSFDDLKAYGIHDNIVHARGCAFAMDPSSGRVSETSGGRIPPPQDSTSLMGGDVPDSGDGTMASHGAFGGSSTPPPTPNTTVGPGGIKIPDTPSPDPGDN